MSRKSILLAVTDPQALVDISQTLGDGWEATPVSSEADALAQLEQRSFDALLVDFNLGSSDASQLLSQALEQRPGTIRFLLAHEADLALVAAKVSGPHEILPKPVEPVSLKSRLENSFAPAESNCNPCEGDPGVSTSAAPAVPAVYSEVLKALESQGVTESQVGEIIAEDAALTSEVLRLSNSAYLGLTHEITDPVEAVESMGLETVRALAMALRFLAEHSQLKPCYLSLEKIWQHSANVGQLARDLMLFETKDRTLAAEALVAGLLHDLGKVVLATNFDDMYGRVHSLARKQPVALWDIEKEMFGANHGEIGACLVGMWNMPSSVVEAAALHHEPPLGEHQHLTPLAAVHIANVLEHQIRPSEEIRVAPAISTAYLNEIGLLQRLPVWHAVFANRLTATAGPEVEPAEPIQPQFTPPAPTTAPPSRTAHQFPVPAALTATATSGQPESEARMSVPPLARQTRWAYAGAIAAVLVLLALWPQTRPDQPVRALAPTTTSARVRLVASPAPAPEPAPAAMPQATPDMAVSEEAPLMTATVSPDSVPLLPQSEQTAATVPQVAATNAPPPGLVPQEKTHPSFRLNGIIYTVARPVAIVNGQTVYVGDRVSGATVVSIDQTQVTLQINGQRQTLVLE